MDYVLELIFGFGVFCFNDFCLLIDLFVGVLDFVLGVCVIV